MTTIDSVGRDTVNVITLASTEANRKAIELAGGPVGLTISTFTNDTLVEADIIFSPASQFTTTVSTDEELQSRGLHDIEAVAAHELGHFIGLHHTGVESGTMWALTSVLQRSLDADDIAGARTLYPVGTPSGTIRGNVTVDGANAFGAQVVAVRRNGVIAASALTLPDGTYAIESIPPDMYTLYAEPLDGPHASVPKGDCVRLGNLSGGGIYNNATLTTNFPTTFFGGNDAPTVLSLAAGSTLQADFALPAGGNAVNPILIGTTVNPENGVSAFSGPAPVVAGTGPVVVVAGSSLEQVSGTGISFAGPGISVDATSLEHRGGSCGDLSFPFILFGVTVAADAAPGGRALLLRSGAQLSTLTGGVDVQPSTPCLGDCDSDRLVAVDELLAGAAILLGTSAATGCNALDPDHTGVTIDRLIRALGNALDRCD